MSDHSASAGSHQHSDFVKAMTLTDATMLVAGSMIGSGIFIVSADISRTLGSPGWLLLAWVLTGVITVLGALAFGELAAMYPRAGGMYTFLRESMGPLMGFLYGWTLFIVIQTGTIAAVAVGFGKFLGVLFPFFTADRWFLAFDINTGGTVLEFGLSWQRVAALVSVWVFTWVNLRGVKEGKWVQTILTFVKTASLIILILLGLTIGRNAEAVAANFSGGNLFAGTPDLGALFVLTFGSALVGSLFSADSWHAPTFAAAEVQNPSRNLPRALMTGTIMVTVLYVLANVAYLAVLPMHGAADGATIMARGIDHATQDRVATAMMESIFGANGALIMAGAIVISTLGCNNGLILSGARVYYAMAKDGSFFARAGVLSRHGVPAFALVVQSIWTSVLCLTGTYNQLLDYVIFAALIFYALTTVGLFLLRRQRPDEPRPYRAIGYPVLPALYVLAASGVAVTLLLAPKTSVQALTGLAIVLLGVPVYYWWHRGARAPQAG
ncbi:MAG TPA: amino acid permease [Gemmatimonadaceae bacterium]|jgi:APA family basic amino acid/polyamine antiporter